MATAQTRPDQRKSRQRTIDVIRESGHARSQARKKAEESPVVSIFSASSNFALPPQVAELMFSMPACRRLPKLVLAHELKEEIGEFLPMLVRESASESTVDALRTGVADLGIVSDAVDTSELVTQPLQADPMIVAVPTRHALSGRVEGVCFSELLAYRWVIGSEQGALFTHLNIRVLAAGGQLHVNMSYPGIEGVLRLVERGMGIPVMSRAAVSRYTSLSTVSMVPLTDP